MSSDFSKRRYRGENISGECFILPQVVCYGLDGTFVADVNGAPYSWELSD